MTPVYNDTRLKRHSLFSTFRDVIAEFDSLFYPPTLISANCRSP